MKTLILSANTGQGHNSCARAIQEAFAAHGEHCDIEDVFALVSVRLSRTIASSHEKSYRQKPKLSDAGYRFIQRHPGLFAKGRPVYQVMSIGRRQVTRCILDGGYDTVLCTHALAALMLTAAVRQGGLSVRTGFVATDYTCSPGVSGTALDRYFIPHELIREEFMAAGIAGEKIISTGIPVQKAFAARRNREESRAALLVPPAHRHLLVMCGSMGCGPIPELVRTVASAMPENWDITVVCGTNEPLKEMLDREHAGNVRVHIRGYEQQMPLLLSSADLYLTKPGGLSTAEAAAAAVPMVFIDAVAGCEESNLRHFTALGAAEAGLTAEEAARKCLSLMNDPGRLEAMAAALENTSACTAAERIRQEMERAG